MGQKADNLNKELVPTRDLLRWLADRVGVAIEDDITSFADQARYQGMLEQALAGYANREGPPSPVDEVLAAGGALVPRPGTAESTDDMDMVDQIAKIVGAPGEGTRRDKLVGIHDALERIMGGGGDVEVPKGDSLAEAMTFGHEQNHQLRDRLRDADMLIQRIAGSLQVTRVKDGDGSEVLEAVQRFEVTKEMMRRRILEQRAAGRTTSEAQRAARVGPGTLLADELELHYTRMLSPGEADAWAKAKGTVTQVVPEHPPHRVTFGAQDLSRLSACARWTATGDGSPPFASDQQLRCVVLAELLEEIHRSADATSYFLASMEATLGILARERASRIKE